MAKTTVKWNPTWEEDWQAAQAELEAKIEEEHPPDPEEAIEYYRYGFVAARRHPLHDWSDVENNLYQDYMTGVMETEPGEEQTGWELARAWTHRGWEAARI